MAAVGLQAVLVLGLVSGACSGGIGGSAAAPPGIADTGAGSPGAVVEAGGYALTPVDPAAVGIDAQVRSPEVQAIADDVTVAVLSQGGHNVGLVLRIMLKPDLRGRPDVVDRFVLAAASGVPVEKTEVAGRLASSYSVDAGSVSPRSQIVLATSGGDLLVFIGTDGAATAAMAGAVVPILDTGEHQ